jgi:hypothetical protein
LEGEDRRAAAGSPDGQAARGPLILWIVDIRSRIQRHLLKLNKILKILNNAKIHAV